MSKTQLAHYKKKWGCKHDGEVVIKAASSRFFPLFWMGDKSTQPSSSAILQRLGIESAMSRDEITVLISDLLGPGNIEMKRLIEDNFSPEPVTESEAEQQSVEKMRERLRNILEQVVCFCEVEVEKDSI